MIAESLTYLLKNLLGIYLVIFILRDIIGYRIRLKKVGMIICSAIVSAWSVLPYIFIDDISLAVDIVDSSTVFLFVIMPYLVLQKKKRLTFLWFGLAVDFLSDLIQNIAVVTLKIESPVADNTAYILLFAVFIVLGKALLYKRSFNIPVDFFEQIPVSLYVVIILASSATYYTTMLPKDSELSETTAGAMLVISAIAAIICLSYIIFKYLLIAHRQAEAEHQLDLQTAYYESMAQKNRDMSAFRHDYENNMYALGELLEQDRIEDAKKYMARLGERVSLTKPKFNTGNRLADAIISHKSEEAAPRGISIDFNGTLPEDKISNNDLCTILSNAIDNAVRGCAELAPCTIKITAREKKNAFTVTVSNPVKEKLVIKNNSVKTTKSDKENHGFGLMNIKRVAEKNNGFVELSCDNNEFVIKIGIIYEVQA